MANGQDQPVLKDPTPILGTAKRSMLNILLILTPDDIDWALNPRSMFKPHDGEALSYADYFLRAYNKRISDLNQPLLVSRMKKKEKKMKSSNSTHDTLHLIPELCTLTGMGSGIDGALSSLSIIIADTLCNLWSLRLGGLSIEEMRVERGCNARFFHIRVTSLPTLLLISGLKDEMRHDYGVMRDLASHSRMAPTERVERMKR